MKIKTISINFLSINSANDTFKQPIISNFMLRKHSPYFCFIQNNGDDILVASGETELQRLKRRQCIIFPANKQHLMQLPNEYAEINVYFSFFYAEIIINNKYKLDDLFEFPCIIPDDFNDTIYQLLDELLKIEDTEQNLCSRMSVAYKVIEILLQIGKMKIIRDEDFLKTVDYIKHNYRKNISVSELAKIANTSPANFYRLFKQQMNTTPIRYLNNYRLSMASSELITTNKKIIDVCLGSGFNDTSYFSKLFIKQFGTSPTEYRKLFKHNIDTTY